MFNIRKFGLIACVAIAVAGCTQSDPVRASLTVDPTMQKYDGHGGGGCTGGQTAGANGICIPPTGRGYEPPNRAQVPGIPLQTHGGGAGGQSQGGRR